MNKEDPGRSRHGDAQDSSSENDGQKPVEYTADSGQMTAFGAHMFSRLSRIIEGDILPRLMLAFDSPRTDRTDNAVSERLHDSVDEFVQLLLSQDASVASRYISKLRDDGMPLPDVYVELLSPAAKRLGSLWDDDRVSFTDVTIGVCRMHQVLLDFSRNFDALEDVVEPGRNILMITVPGEQHTLGISILLEFLRRDGWNCFTGAPADMQELRRLVEAHDFAVIGLSVSADRHVSKARRAVAEIRDGRRNANTPIIVGGKVFIDNPELADTVDADGVASDAPSAVELIKSLSESAAGKPAT